MPHFVLRVRTYAQDPSMQCERHAIAVEDDRHVRYTNHKEPEVLVSDNIPPLMQKVVCAMGLFKPSLAIYDLVIAYENEQQGSLSSLLLNTRIYFQPQFDLQGRITQLGPYIDWRPLPQAFDLQKQKLFKHYAGLKNDNTFALVVHAQMIKHAPTAMQPYQIQRFMKYLNNHKLTDLYNRLDTVLMGTWLPSLWAMTSIGIFAYGIVGFNTQLLISNALVTLFAHYRYSETMRKIHRWLPYIATTPGLYALLSNQGKEKELLGLISCLYAFAGIATAKQYLMSLHVDIIQQGKRNACLALKTIQTFSDLQTQPHNSAAQNNPSAQLALQAKSEIDLSVTTAEAVASPADGIQFVLVFMCMVLFLSSQILAKDTIEHQPSKGMAYYFPLAAIIMNCLSVVGGYYQAGKIHHELKSMKQDSDKKYNPREALAQVPNSADQKFIGPIRSGLQKRWSFRLANKQQKNSDPAQIILDPNSAFDQLTQALRQFKVN